MSVKTEVSVKEFDTTRFGRLSLPEEAVIHFPVALLGLDNRHDYCLLEHDNMAGFYWLQSLQDPAVALIVTDPFRHIPEYEVEIPDSQVELLRAKDPSDLTLYTTISMAADHSQVCTNLLGPLAINHEERVGTQIVQHGSNYTCRHTLAMRQPVEKV